MQDWAALLTAVGAALWPVVVVAVVLLFRRPLIDLLRRDSVAIEAPGFKLSAQREKEAAEAYAAAMAERGAGSPGTDAAHAEVRDVAGVVEILGYRPHLLWVDDRPSNNSYERATMAALGMTFDLSADTADALERIRRTRYDLIISDMGRPSGQTAGYRLLETLRAAGNTTPFIIYAASADPEHFDEAVRRGAEGSTNRPDVLIEFVTAALRSGARRRHLT